jgi:hypothetical protein
MLQLEFYAYSPRLLPPLVVLANSKGTVHSPVSVLRRLPFIINPLRRGNQ